jgi:hypothetical protein
MTATNYPVLFLFPINNINSSDLKTALSRQGIKVRYNSGQIPQSLVNTVAPMGGMILPMGAQDAIFDPLDIGDYSNFDMSMYWSSRDKKDIELHGASDHLIAAGYVTVKEIIALEKVLKGIGNIYVWQWHQWIIISNIEAMNWAYD